MGLVADWEEGFGEADAILRGRDGLPGVMGEALTTLMTWARDGLGLKRIGLRVRSDNPQAVRVRSSIHMRWSGGSGSGR